MDFLWNWCKGFLCILSISVLSACGGKSSSREVLISNKDYIIDLYTSKEKVESPISEDERKVLEQRYKNGEFPERPSALGAYFREIHELRQELNNGTSYTIYSRETLRAAQKRLYEEKDTFSIFRIWRVDSSNYMLINAYKDLLLLELIEEPDGVVSVQEIKLAYLSEPYKHALISYYGPDNSISITVPYPFSGTHIAAAKRYIVTKDKKLAVKESWDTTRVFPYIAPSMWRTFNEKITSVASSTQDADHTAKDFVQTDKDYIEMRESFEWWQDLSKQARSKVFVRLVNQIFEVRARTEFDQEGELSDAYAKRQMPTEIAFFLDGYREQVGLEPVGDSTFDSFFALGGYYRTHNTYFENEVTPRVRQQLSSATLEERLAYARNPQPEICPTELDVALALLSKDSDPFIRKAVIENPWTDPFVILSMMEDETNPDVFAALDAYEKEVHIIPPEDERPLPPGW